MYSTAPAHLFLLLIIETNYKFLLAQVSRGSIKLLYNHLFVDGGYNSKIRPKINWTQTTVVNTSFAVVSLNDYNEVTETISLTGKVTVEWTDDYLTWDPSHFDGLDQLNLPQNDVWRPDIALENSVTSYEDLGDPEMFVSIDFTGRMTWKPLKAFHSACIADVTRFPLDEQTCLLKFEAWSHSVKAVELRSKYDKMDLRKSSGLPEWEIVETEAVVLYEGGDRYVGFYFTIQRRPLYLFLNVILPVAAISFLGQGVFLLPLESGEKASFSVTVLLSMTVFLTIVSQHLPHTPDHVSLFNVFVISQVLICTAITVITLLQLRLFHMDHSTAVPSFVRKLMNTGLFVCRKKPTHRVESTSVVIRKFKSQSGCDDTCRSRRSVSSVNDLNQELDDGVGEDDNSNSALTVTWVMVARWIDLRAFWTMFLLNVAFIIASVASISSLANNRETGI